MPKLHKSNRSLAKRVKISASGKVIKRKPGQNHFNAKDSGSAGLHKRGFKPAPGEYQEHFQALLPGKNVTVNR